MGKKALVVGINDYENFNCLNCCSNDAEEIGGILGLKEYDFDVKTVLNEQATRRNITQELHELFSSDCDTLLFYFAGHGLVSQFTTYLVTVDGDNVESGIDLDYLRKWSVNINNNKTLIIILDCCHSGAAKPRSGTENNLREITNGDIERALLSLGAGKVILAACQADQVAYEEPTINHGIFTYYLLEGLYGDAADSAGDISIPFLYDYVSKKFSNSCEQKPVFKGDISGRIVIGSGLTPRHNLELPKDEVVQIETQAQELMNEYIKYTTFDIESWKHHGYREACDMLTPRIQWLDRQLTKYPRLLSHQEFSSAYSTAKSKIADLGRLMEGMNTKLGLVEKKIGAGTFGTVWKLQSEDRTCAYKVYHPTDLDNREKIARFRRGYDAMGQLDHTHIVKVSQYTDCPVGFVMNYIEGPNLRDFASTKPDSAEILTQLLAVADTLKHAHSRGIVHRDVKPENIIMHWEVDKYRPYLTDFDLAWFSTATQFTKEGVGSFIYAAPEQLAKPTAQVAHQPTTDIYAFGQLIFFFICKRDPVMLLADNSRALSNEVRNWGFEEPARKIVNLFEECTNQDPSKRIRDFRDVSDRLFEIFTLISQEDHLKIISIETFIRQLIFSIIGLSPEKSVSPNSFRSPSERVQIVITHDVVQKKVNLTFQLYALDTPILEGADSHKDLRMLINQRIDNVISNFSDVSLSRHPGKQSGFETFIDFKHISINIEGVEICRQILTRIIDCIEGK